MKIITVLILALFGNNARSLRNRRMFVILHELVIINATILIELFKKHDETDKNTQNIMSRKHKAWINFCYSPHLKIC